MEYVFLTIVALIVGIIHYYNKANKNKTDAILGETRGQDKVLAQEQNDVDKALDDLDKGIQKIKVNRKKQKNLSNDERADKWNK